MRGLAERDAKKAEERWAFLCHAKVKSGFASDRGQGSVFAWGQSLPRGRETSSLAFLIMFFLSL